MQYKISYGTKVVYKTVSFDANGGETLDDSVNLKREFSGSSYSLTMPNNMFSKEGYEFLGWSTNSSATSNVFLPGTSVTVTSNTEYYAIWRKKKFPVFTYDVFTDGTNYATVIRKAWYYDYNSSVSLTNTSFSGENAYSDTGSSVAWYAGDNGYAGFSRENAYQIISMSGQTYEWTASGKGSSSVTDISPGAVTVPLWAYFVWTLNDPVVSIESATADYGTPIYLDNNITATHDAEQKTFVYVWNNAVGTDVTFYTDSHILYTVAESGVYYAEITVIVEKNGIQLFKTKATSSAEYSIKPLRLVLQENPEVLYYNGNVREFGFKTVIDRDYYLQIGYSADAIENMSNIFATEEQGRPYYYDENGNNVSAKWKYGVIARLIALSYVASVGEGLYSGSFETGSSQNLLFKDAGLYWVDQVALYHNTVDGFVASFNPNYVWAASVGKGDEQVLLADYLGGEENYITATILPAQSALNIYLLYFWKVFGIIDDPVPVFSNGFSEDNLDYVKTEGAAFVAIEGLLGSDAEFYGDLIAQKLFRDKMGFYQNVGRYDVYLELLGSENLAAIYNNYGLKLNSLSDTFVSENGGDGYGGISLFWVDYVKSDASEELVVTNKGTPFRFTGSFEEFFAANPSLVVDVFEILPNELQLVQQQTTAGTYDGQEQGLRYVATGFPALTSDDLYGESGQEYVDTLKTSFYGIIKPADWDTMTEAEKSSYALANRRLMGDNANGGVVSYGENENYIWFRFG